MDNVSPNGYQLPFSRIELSPLGLPNVVNSIVIQFVLSVRDIPPQYHLHSLVFHTKRKCQRSRGYGRLIIIDRSTLIGHEINSYASNKDSINELELAIYATRLKSTDFSHWIHQFQPQYAQPNRNSLIIWEGCALINSTKLAEESSLKSIKSPIFVKKIYDKMLWGFNSINVQLGVVVSNVVKFDIENFHIVAKACISLFSPPFKFFLVKLWNFTITF